MDFEPFSDSASFLFCLYNTLSGSWLRLWRNNTMYIYLYIYFFLLLSALLALLSGWPHSSLKKPPAKRSTGTRWHSSVLRQIPKWQRVLMSWRGERESRKEPADPADSLNLRKSGNWVIKQTPQVMGVWILLNGTATAAPPGEGGAPERCFPSRGIRRRCGSWQAAGRYMWAALWFPFLPGQLFPGWLQDVSPQSPFFPVWPKLSKANLNKGFHWRPPRNTYLPEKTVLVMQEMASFPLSQSWIGPAGQEEGGWSYRADSNRYTRAFPIQPPFRFKTQSQRLVQPASQYVHLMSV